MGTGEITSQDNYSRAGANSLNALVSTSHHSPLIHVGEFNSHSVT